MTLSKEDADRIQAYVRGARDYLAQAEELLRQGEADKAGEMLWGALNRALSALFLPRWGHPVREHQELRRALRQLAQANPPWEQLRETGERLHANFYHRFLDTDDLRSIAPLIAEGVRQLLSIVPQTPQP